MKKSSDKLQRTGRLQLHRETLRRLEPWDLAPAHGAKLDEAKEVNKTSWPTFCPY